VTSAQSTARPDIRFEHALTAQAVFDLVEDGAGGELVFEQTPGTVDYERADHAGKKACIVRGTTGPEPYTVLSGDLWESLRRWSRGDASETVHVFQTDGTLFPSAVIAVADRLERFAKRVESAEDHLVARAAGIEADSEVLRHVRLRTRSGATAAIVDDVDWRARRLGRNGGAHGDPAEAGTSRLLRRSTLAGSGDRCSTISQEEALALLAVDASDLEHHALWTAELERRYRAALLGAPAGPGGGDDAPLLVGGTPVGRGPLPTGEHELVAPGSVTDLLGLPGGAVVVGAAGQGKAAALGALSRTAAESGAIPVTLEARRYVTGSLNTAVRRRVESVAGSRLSAAGARQLLRSSDLVLLLDGVSEHPELGSALVSAVTDARVWCPTLVVVAVGWSGSGADPLGLPLFALDTPDCATSE
jgi:hypothetical protein